MASEDPRMQSLLASIGNLLLYWGYFETDLNAQLANLSQTSSLRQPLDQRLLALERHAEKSNNPALLKSVQNFCATARQLTNTRNVIAHGLTAADATTSPSSILCNDINGSQTKMTEPELKDTAAQIDALRRTLRNLARP